MFDRAMRGQTSIRLSPCPLASESKPRHSYPVQAPPCFRPPSAERFPSSRGLGRAPVHPSGGPVDWGLAPEECMYVDDIAVYLEPARETGMRVVHHTDATTTIRELETIFMVPLPI